jgi:hypothetical protein
VTNVRSGRGAVMGGGIVPQAVAMVELREIARESVERGLARGHRGRMCEVEEYLTSLAWVGSTTRTVLGTIPDRGPVSPRQNQCIWPIKFKIYIQI